MNTVESGRRARLNPASASTAIPASNQRSIVAAGSFSTAPPRDGLESSLPHAPAFRCGDHGVISPHGQEDLAAQECLAAAKVLPDLQPMVANVAIEGTPRMRHRLLAASSLLALAWLAPAPANAGEQDVGLEAQTGVAVTIYNQDLALVRDVRTIDLAA